MISSLTSRRATAIGIVPKPLCVYSHTHGRFRLERRPRLPRRRAQRPADRGGGPARGRPFDPVAADRRARACARGQALRPQPVGLHPDRPGPAAAADRRGDGAARDRRRRGGRRQLDLGGGDGPDRLARGLRKLFPGAADRRAEGAPPAAHRSSSSPPRPCSASPGATPTSSSRSAGRRRGGCRCRS